MTLKIPSAKRVYRDGPTIESGNAADPPRDCRAEIGIAINRPESEKPLVTMVLYYKEAEKMSWNGELGVDQTQNTGGLGPTLDTTLKSTSGDFPYDLDVGYDVDSWKWSECEFMSDSNLGQGVTMQSRKCTFQCRG